MGGVNLMREHENFKIPNVFTPSEEKAERLYKLIMSTPVYDPKKAMKNFENSASHLNKEK